MTHSPDQLGLEALLTDADADNAAQRFEQHAAHLPDSLEVGIAYYRRQMGAHHDTILGCDFEAALAIRIDAHRLARKLNGGNRGILAHDDAPGYVLARETKASPGTVPLWGQDGRFELSTGTMRVAVTMQGMFGIGATAMTYLGLEARAVDPTEPFPSETGYRSFLGACVEPEPGLTVDGFCTSVIEAHVAQGLRGTLCEVLPKYQKRAMH